MKGKTLNENKRGLFTNIISFLVCAVLISSQVIILSVNTTHAQSKNDKDAERRINELVKLGNQYKMAMKDVNSLSAKSLESEAEITQAVKTLDRHKATLIKGGYASLFILAANDSAFIADIQAKANEMGEEKFAEMLKSNPKMVLEFKNAKKIQSNVTRQLKQYLKDFRTLGTKLKDAGEKSNDKMSLNYDRLNSPYSTNNAFALSKVSYNLPSSYNSDFDLQGNTEFTTINFTNKTAIDWGKFVEISIKIIVEQVIKEVIKDFDPAPDGGPSDNDICLGKAQDKLESCLEKAEAKKGFNKWLSKQACYAEFALNQGICMFLPQSYPNS